MRSSLRALSHDAYVLECTAFLSWLPSASQLPPSLRLYLSSRGDVSRHSAASVLQVCFAGCRPTVPVNNVYSPVGCGSLAGCGSPSIPASPLGFPRPRVCGDMFGCVWVRACLRVQSKGYSVRPVPRLADVDPGGLLSALLLRRGVSLPASAVSTILSKRCVGQAGA